MWAIPAATLWLAAVVGLALFLRRGARAEAVFASLDVDQSGLTQLCVVAGRALDGAMGIAIVAGVLVVTLMPILLGARSAGTAKGYLGLAVRSGSAPSVRCGSCRTSCRTRRRSGASVSRRRFAGVGHGRTE